MPRRNTLALGLLAAALAAGPSTSTPARAGVQKQGAPAPASAAAGHGNPAAATAADAAHAAEAGHGEADPNILEPQPSLAIWTVVVFVGLLAVLGRYAWGPMITALHQREEHLQHVLSETERARNESEAMLAEHRKQLASAQDQIRAMLDDARKTATTSADEIVAKAQAEAESSKKRAEQDITSAKDQALSEIVTRTADLAVSVAGKVLGQSMTGDDHRRLVDSAVTEIAAAGGANGRQGRAS